MRQKVKQWSLLQGMYGRSLSLDIGFRSEKVCEVSLGQSGSNSKPTVDKMAATELQQWNFLMA